MSASKDLPPTNPWLVSMVSASEHWLSLQKSFMDGFQQVFNQATAGTLPEIKDKRFSSDAWKQNPQLLSLAHLYLLSSKTLFDMLEQVEMDAESKDKLLFAMHQWVDAVAPSNFFALNADALATFEKTHGESLQKGLQNLLQDMQKGRITQTDEQAFEVGRNLAVTPGKVVYKNAFIELIQYSPLTPQVYEIPLLVVPPCINKFYILDLQEDDSFVRGAVEQGHTVFLISWRNPLPNDVDQPDLFTWDDYMEQGVIRALQAVCDITKQPKINTLGFCVGGTMLATALAVAKARGQDYANSMTLLTTFLDFSDTGVMHVFVDEPSVVMREQTIGQGGLMPAKDLAASFSILRPNELIWNYVVQNYFKGETPVPFDILYWNSDSTNLPGPFYAWYLRNTYLENNLRQPGKVTVLGEPLKLSTLDMDTYLYASKDDHIVPWKSAYLSRDILSGQVQFCLGASGHVAGVVNPPARHKRHYWTNEYKYDDGYLSSEQWFEDATQHPGSWWVNWYEWLAPRAGRKIKAKKTLGSRQYRPSVDAPGDYVKVRAVQ
ncbi:PHA/PHB synthase family protein [Pelistega europaea]|uniref:Class I poly(R)-hydroxyalkanoic acid synthase n=1 Tax=Pelistega europaea TaxID=106147 RepID=A0A7Y4P535_9BURK|nr:class I poly(R)-hydroxyalkanoic acid synthase [Pelistega europaea]NOL49363.1 class I poly(R)-hydroxyalkanoic acid synthase [Pelistega europaea]